MVAFEQGCCGVPAQRRARLPGPPDLPTCREEPTEPLLALGDGIRVRRRTSRRACSSTARTIRAIARCPTATSSSRDKADRDDRRRLQPQRIRRGAGQQLRRRELAAGAGGAVGSAASTPEDVSSIFITHAHFDHMGALDQYPNATFYIQERELTKWVWAMSLERRFRWLMLGIDPADIMKAVDLARQGRLVCVDGDRENVLPGIDLHAAFDTHTWGCQYVTSGTICRRTHRTRGCFPATSSTRTKTCAARIRTTRSTCPSGWPRAASFRSS